MFTGLIEATGTVRSIQNQGSHAVLAIDLGKLTDQMQLGDSVAVNGVCLTVTRLTHSVGSFDVSQETLKKAQSVRFGLILKSTWKERYKSAHAWAGILSRAT